MPPYSLFLKKITGAHYGICRSQDVMSERAVEAYKRGEKPLSKWTKDEILKCIESCYPDAAELCSHFSLSFLRKHFLYCSSWHHTGKYYQKTYFYKFETELYVEDILAMKETKKSKPEASEFYPVTQNPLSVRPTAGATESFSTRSAEQRSCVPAKPTTSSGLTARNSKR